MKSTEDDLLSNKTFVEAKRGGRGSFIRGGEDEGASEGKAGLDKDDEQLQQDLLVQDGLLDEQDSISC